MPFTFGSCLDRAGLQSASRSRTTHAKPESPRDGSQSATAEASKVMPAQFTWIPTETKLA